jgi:hypothetical protein
MNNPDYEAYNNIRDAYINKRNMTPSYKDETSWMMIPYAPPK